MSSTTSGILRSQSPNPFVFEFSLEIPGENTGTAKTLRNYEETIQAGSTDARMDAIHSKVKAAIEAIATELKIDPLGIQCVMAKRSGKEIFITGMMPEKLLFSPREQSQVEAGVMNGEALGEPSGLHGGQGLIQHSRRYSAVQFPQDAHGNGESNQLPKSQSMIIHRLWSDEVLSSVSADNEVMIGDKLRPIIDDILHQAKEIERILTSTSQLEKAGFYHEKFLECEAVLEELMECYPGNTEEVDLKKFMNWLFFHEIKNTPQATLSSWGEVDRYLAGMKGELFQLITDPLIRSAVLSDLEVLFDLEQEKRATELRIQDYEKRITDLQNAQGEGVDLLEELLRTEQYSFETLSEQIKTLKGKLFEIRPVSMQPIWDDFLHVISIWEQILSLNEGEKYVPATLRFEVYAAIQRISQKGGYAPLVMNERLCHDFSLTQNHDEGFGRFSRMFMDALKGKMDFNQGCIQLDRLHPFFAELWSQREEQGVFEKFAEKRAENPVVQSAILIALQQLSSVFQMEERIVALHNQSETVIPPKQQLLAPEAVSNRRAVLEQLEKVELEMKSIETDPLTRYCSATYLEQLSELRATIAFCKMQFHASVEQVQLSAFFKITHLYLDAITQKKWGSQLYVEKRNLLQESARDIAQLKSRDSYQNPDSAYDLQPILQQIETMQEQQKQILECTIIGDSTEVKNWVRDFLEFLCLNEEKRELKKAKINDRELIVKMLALYQKLSPMQFS